MSALTTADRSELLHQFTPGRPLDGNSRKIFFDLSMFSFFGS